MSVPERFVFSIVFVKKNDFDFAFEDSNIRKINFNYFLQWNKINY